MEASGAVGISLASRDASNALAAAQPPPPEHQPEVLLDRGFITFDKGHACQVDARLFRVQLVNVEVGVAIEAPVLCGSGQGVVLILWGAGGLRLMAAAGGGGLHQIQAIALAEDQLPVKVFSPPPLVEEKAAAAENHTQNEAENSHKDTVAPFRGLGGTSLALATGHQAVGGYRSPHTRLGAPAGIFAQRGLQHSHF